MGNTATVQSAHMTGRASRHEHIASCQFAGSHREIEQVSLRGKHQPMLRLGVNFHLRMIRPEMALAARAWKSREFNGRRMTSMTSGAIADRSVLVWFADAVAARASALRCGCAFE